MSQDIVENVDLPITEPIRIRNKKIGDAPQCVDAFVPGAAMDRVFQLSNK
jgi:hypothetical protein